MKHTGLNGFKLCADALFAHCCYESVIHTVPVDVAKVKHRDLSPLYLLHISASRELAALAAESATDGRRTAYK
ncbi:hypothetical protein [Vibrio neptunius]|uniref:Uncharacterized protein n=1 Tax=Vibrio neptunius TaxID=170651 RepID=A0ABS3A778_9VIBR|nr:hypothetical protein [Vibrio neptunius]MBN3495480.1 hypothetical protein [Vibrio neptunius]MBN3517484.1 hypothetical protein [Vibrio neptunius]MBN3551823.1 hypothetical protein [Vibrio neptunius]MBN3580326.1 hypothetical protein [Vibrio neptunius]MCH9873992.1 hypothetical protein [Vibrio neptunius]